MKPELLAPCHDFATLRAAIKGGADAVYFGVQTFNMRLKAGNFTIEELSEVVRICHEAGVKAYLTTNVVLFEGEQVEIKRLLTQAKEAGVDAVIVSDLAVLKIARGLGLEVHVSTQASVANSTAVNVLKSLGASRVILARELSLKQVKEVASKSSIPVEVFIHGAMCVSISGRCFFSQFMYGANANRGECYQPCRQPWTVKNPEGEFVYDGERFLNSKDLCMIEHIPELIDSGVASLKIEGRMKDANYVSTVTRVYREAINDFKEERVPEWLFQLRSVFNRDFCTGFYFGEPEETDEPGSQATTRKEYLGEVLNYYAEPGVAEVILKGGDLKIGETIIIESREKFHKQEVTSIEIDNSPIECASKGDCIGLQVNERVRRGMQVYKVIIT